MSENKEEQPPAETTDGGSGPRQPGAGGDKVPPAAKPADSGPQNPGGGGN
jgi:hypothetical protein